MILQFPEWYLGYEEIVDGCRKGDDGTAKTALLLCNADVDAMAAARIMSFMLRSDGINYQLLPCTNLSALEKTLSQQTQMDDVAAVVMLNFGASKNLTRLFDAHLNDDIKIYVMDSRRPVHLANIHDNENVVVFWDNTQKTEDVPSDGDNLSGNESSSSEDDNSDDDDDEDDSDDDDDTDDEDEEEASFDDVVDATERREEDASAAVANESLEEQSPDYDGEDEGGEDTEQRVRQRPGGKDGKESSDAGGSPEKKRRTDDSAGIDGETDGEHSEHDGTTFESQKEISPRESHRQRRDRLRAYYAVGSFHGSPASFVAYTLATQMRFGEKGDLLWLACVGLTDAYLHGRLDQTGYTTITMRLKMDALRLFPDDEFTRSIHTVYAEDLISGFNNDQNAKTKVTFSHNGMIMAEKDFRFFLLRHTSLFDSMVHSDYISTKMQVWTKKGMQRLMELLATMGYPLDECKQPFAFMQPNLRRVLHNKLTENAEEFGLDHFDFTSFFRVTGYQSLLSASDVSYAVTALLECDNTAIEENIDEEKQAIESFNMAYDALNCNAAPSVRLNGLNAEGHDASNLVNGGNLAGSTGIGAGIRMAMGLQRQIISTAVGMVDRNAITLLRHFRFAYLTCTSAGENQTARLDIVKQRKPSEEDKTTHIFSKALALTRLAHYLMDMHRENGKWTGSKSRPLVLCAEKPQTGTYLVVGYENPEQVGQLQKNKFGMKFEVTAKSMNGTFKFDSFDSNVVEVDGNDVQRFIEQLHYILDSI